MKRLLMVAFALAAGAAPVAAQDGEVMFNNNCRTCHTTKEGDNRLGPSLAGVVGRKAGALEGFNFSESLKDSGITWDEASLDKFIENPEAVVRGNNMKPYGGMDSAEDRKTIIEFLKSKSGG